MKILIADDDDVHRNLLQRQVKRAGYDVLEVADGQAAWELIESGEFRFVITDWMMPGLTGPELTRRIRAAELPAYVYVILLSVRADRSDVIEGLDSGVDDYLVKPCEYRELRLRIAIGMRVINLETRLRESLTELHRLATHDTLTELFNRRAIYEYIEAELARGARKGQPLSLVLLDIDHFKSINDRYGHPVGDEVLRQVARTILHGIRPYDKAARWGGEEFLLVFPGVALAEAGIVAERVRAHIAALRLPLSDGTEFSVYASMGVASSTMETPLHVGDLISQADTALYQAKHQGRNQVVLFNPNCSNQEQGAPSTFHQI